MFAQSFRLILFSLTLVAGLGLSSRALAQSEEERHKDFYRQLEQAKQFNHERELGYKDFLRQQAEWEEQRAKDKKADKTRKREGAPVEGGPEYKADLQDKLEARQELEVARKELIKEKKSKESKNAAQQAQREAWAMEEYGLPEKRPRFDIAKRTLYGGKPGGSSNSGGPSSPGGFGGRGAMGNEGGQSFPPPPAFDDFNDNFPPPPVVNPEQFENPEGYPPVPPPPMAPTGGDFDNGYFPPPNMVPENMGGDSF